MGLPSKEELINLIKNANATIYDLAAQFYLSPQEVEKKLVELGVPFPSMSLEGSYDFIKSLAISGPGKCSPEELLGNLGNLVPDKGIREYERLFNVYEKVHGGFVDNYTQEKCFRSRVIPIDGDYSNWLISNLECLSVATEKLRVSHLIGPVTEMFNFSTKHFSFELTITKKYDQVVGGTYNPEYVNLIFNTWVKHPLDTYFSRHIEEDVLFKHRTPTYIAWWAWSQLAQYGLLKGIDSIKVTSGSVASLLKSSNVFSTLKLSEYRSVSA